MIFDYPESITERFHGPAGYTNLQRFRDWVRDEFIFRCVYCLRRETWEPDHHVFESDHLAPVSLDKTRELDYSNLLYACRVCNGKKGQQQTDDPLTTLRFPIVHVLPDGTLRANDEKAARMIKQVGLNSSGMKRWRLWWMRAIELAFKNDQNLFKALTGFPDDLPDLRTRREPYNSRPESKHQCWFALRERGLLPASIDETQQLRR